MIAVPVNAVKTIPLPSRTGQVNPVANDTESQVPQAAQAAAEETGEGSRREGDSAPQEPPRGQAAAGRQSPQRYRPQPPLPNQVFSQQRARRGFADVRKARLRRRRRRSKAASLGSRFGAYADLVAQRVSEKWQTGGLAGLHTAPVVVITFDIQTDGSIRNAKIAQHSGNDTLDYSALRAVTDAAPFPPLPAGYTGARPTSNCRFQLQR